MKARHIVGLHPFQIARLGIGFAPEESEVFGELTVAENIAMPTWTCPDPRPAEERIAEAYKVFPEARALPRARRRRRFRAASARWCRSRARWRSDPKLLLLDEPTEGLSPAIVPSIVEGLGNIRAFGHAVFIAESNIHHVPDFTDRLYVIERGEIIFAGKPAEARRNPAVAG